MKIKLIAILLSLSLFFVLPLNLSADDLHEQEIKESFVQLGIAEEDAENLTEKHINGTLIDSLNEDFDDIEPESIIEYDGYYEERYVYPDKSVRVVTIEDETPPNDSILPLSIFTGYISGGTRRAGTYWWTWTRARVTATWGVVTGSFYANMEGSTASGKISSVYEYSVVVLGGTFSNVSLNLIKQNADYLGPAYAYLYFEGQVTQGFGHGSFYLRLRVPRGGNAVAQFQVL